MSLARKGLWEGGVTDKTRREADYGVGDNCGDCVGGGVGACAVAVGLGDSKLGDCVGDSGDGCDCEFVGAIRVSAADEGLAVCLL
jgi:hypothetical protein